MGRQQDDLEFVLRKGGNVLRECGTVICECLLRGADDRLNINEEWFWRTARKRFGSVQARENLGMRLSQGFAPYGRSLVRGEGVLQPSSKRAVDRICREGLESLHGCARVLLNLVRIDHRGRNSQEIEQLGRAGQPFGDMRRQELRHDSGDVEIFHDALLDVVLDVGVSDQRRERGDEAILLGEPAVRARESYRQRSRESTEHDEHGPQYSKRGPRWRISTGGHVPSTSACVFFVYVTTRSPGANRHASLRTSRSGDRVG